MCNVFKIRLFGGPFTTPQCGPFYRTRCLMYSVRCALLRPNAMRHNTTWQHMYPLHALHTPYVQWLYVSCISYGYLGATNFPKPIFYSNSPDSARLSNARYFIHKCCTQPGQFVYLSATPYIPSPPPPPPVCATHTRTHTHAHTNMHTRTHARTHASTHASTHGRCWLQH